MSMLTVRHLTLPFSVATLFSAVPAAAAETSPRNESVYGKDIIVIGKRLPDPMLADVQPVDTLGEPDIAGYGANTLSGLLADLGRQLAAGGDSAPLVLLNGRRILSLAEVADLPTEAIKRVELLSAPLALRFGGSASQKVLNFVLQPQLRSTNSTAGGGLATEGGGRYSDLAMSLTQVAGNNRLSVSGKAYTRRGLLESERNIAQPAGDADDRRFRTLQPEVHSYSLRGTLGRELSNSAKLSAAGGVSYDTSLSLHGLAIPNESGELFDDSLNQKIRNVGAFLDLGVTADAGRWSLSATGGYGQRTSDTWTERQFHEAEVARERAHARSRNVGLTLDASGPLVELPAGDLRVSFYGDLSRSSLHSRVRGPGSESVGERGRTDAGAWLSAELPLSKQDGSAGILGGISGNLKAGIRSVSDIGTLHSFAAGLSWQPSAAINVTASFKADRQPPNLMQVASPVIETSGIRAFDYVRGETVELTSVSGGNPDLLRDRRRTFALSGSFRPFGARSLRISVDYKNVRLDHPVAGLPPATAQVQAAFPERFGRDPSGVLIRLDRRPVNFERQNLAQLRWGLAWRRSAAAPRAAGTDSASRQGVPGLGLELSLDHTLALKNRVLLRPGLPVLDLLHGGASDSNGGQPRHVLQWEVAVNKSGFGARLIGSWRSGTFVTGSTGVAADRLRFSPLMQHEVRVFADLENRLPGSSWARDTRLSVIVSNVLNKKPRVRDASGTTPIAYQPDYLDPVGRTVSISLRKNIP